MKGTNRIQWSSLILVLIASLVTLAIASLSEDDSLPAASPSAVELIAEPGVGDGHPATEVPIGSGAALTVDGTGAIYFVDPVYKRVRRIDPDGTIDSVFNGYAMDVPSAPVAVAVDQRSGAVYVADDVANRVWIIRDGTPQVLAGTGAYGFSGDGGAAASAELRMPRGLALDAGGTLYIADMGNHRIRAVAPDGTIRTVAGTLPPESEWKHVEPVESLFLPTLVAVGADASLFAVDRSGQRLLRLAPDGSAQGLAYGRGLNSITVASDGNLLLADAAGLRKLHDGRWSPVVRGSGLTIATSLDATIVAYDWRSHRIVRLHDEESNEQVAGNGTIAHFGDGGPANGATFSCYDVIVGLQGEIVFSDTLNGRVAVIRDGHIHTLALVSGALGLGYDARGVVYVADQASHRVLAIDTAGKIEPVAGNGVAGFSGDGGKATDAELSRPSDVVVRADGALLISDSENERVRLVDTQGIITTLANFDRPTGSLFLHPNGQLVVSLRGGYELIEFEPTGVPALLKVAASTGGDDARSRREALAFTPHGELLFVRDGQLYGAKGSGEAYPLSLGAPSLTGTTRLAVGADDDLVRCDARQRILRVAGSRLREAVTAVALR